MSTLADERTDADCDSSADSKGKLPIPTLALFVILEDNRSLFLDH